MLIKVLKMEEEDEVLVNGKYWQYEKARAFLQSLKFKTISDFRRWWTYETHATEDSPFYINGSNIECPRRPKFLPYCPRSTYYKNFIGIRDFVLNKRPFPLVGFKAQNSQHLWSYIKASQFLQNYNFASSQDYFDYCSYSCKQQPGDPDYINSNNISCPKRPRELPMNPRRAYYNVWTGWNNYLHGKNHAKHFTMQGSRPLYKYEVAKAYIKKLKFTDIEDYYEWIDYSKAWKPGAPLFVTKAGKHIRKKPTFIPYKPNEVYKKDFISLHSYISLHYADETKKPRGEKINSVHERFKSSVAFTYEEAKEFIHMYKFTSVPEFRLYCNHSTSEPFVTKSGLILPILPRNMPKSPDQYYMKTEEWVSWYDFLNIPEKEDKSEKVAEMFEKTKYTFYKTATEWHNEMRKLGPGVVSYINKAARLNQWDGFHVELNRSNTKICSYENAKILLSFRNLKNHSQYTKWYSKHNNPFFMPYLRLASSLNHVYNDDTLTFDDFLTVDMVEKLNTQKLAIPVFVVILTQDSDFKLDVIRAGKYEAYLKYGNKSNCYVFEFTDRTLLDTILTHHCTQFSANEYSATHLGQLYVDMRNNFKQISFASLND